MQSLKSRLTSSANKPHSTSTKQNPVRHSHKHWVVILFAPFYLLHACVALAQSNSEEQYKKSLNNISKEINTISKRLNVSKSKLEAEQTQLLKAEKELYQITQKLEEAKRGIQASKKLIEELAIQQEQLKKEQQISRTALAELIQANHKNGRVSQLKQVLSQEDPYAVGRLNNYQGYFGVAIEQKFAELEAQVQALGQVHKQQKKKIIELQVLEQEQEFLKRTQENKRSERKRAVEKLNAQVQAGEGKLKKLNQDRARLNSLIKKLEQQRKELERIERERKEAERLAREKAKQEGKKPPKKVVRAPVKGGFLKQKGRLTCPVSVTPKTKFGQRIVSSGMKSEGVFYQTKTTQDVRSIFRGQVLFADFLKGFGLLLIVDHGDDHISLYGHNRVLYKKVGDAVATNEVISQTGTTGGLKSNGLYFEIRNNTTPVNPSKWCQ